MLGESRPGGLRVRVLGGGGHVTLLLIVHSGGPPLHCSGSAQEASDMSGVPVARLCVVDDYITHSVAWKEMWKWHRSTSVRNVGHGRGRPWAIPNGR